MDPKFLVVTVPIMLAGLVLRSTGPAEKFRRAGAISEGTAISSTKVGIERRFLLEGDLRAGLLVATPAGRYYADPAAMKRRWRRRLVFAVTIVAVSLGGIWWWTHRG